MVKKGHDLQAFTVRAGGAPTEEQLIGTQVPTDMAQILTPLQGLVEEQVADARRQIAELIAERNRFQTEAAATRSDLERLRTTRANLVKECDEHGQELAILRDQVVSTRGELDTLQHQYTAITREKEQMLTDLDQRRGELVAEVAVLSAQVEIIRQFIPVAPTTADLSTVPAEFRENLRDQVNARLPIVDVKALTHAAHQSGVQKQDIIKAALRAYLGKESYQAACQGLGLAALKTQN